MPNNYVEIRERWTRTSGERKIGDGPWEPIDLSIYGGKPPFIVLDEEMTEWHTVRWEAKRATTPST